jgi:hypothetical protein
MERFQDSSLSQHCPYMPGWLKHLRLWPRKHISAKAQAQMSQWQASATHSAVGFTLWQESSCAEDAYWVPLAEWGSRGPSGSCLGGRPETDKVTGVPRRDSKTWTAEGTGKSQRGAIGNWELVLADGDNTWGGDQERLRGIFTANKESLGLLFTMRFIQEWTVWALMLLCWT